MKAVQHHTDLDDSVVQEGTRPMKFKDTGVGQTQPVVTPTKVITTKPIDSSYINISDTIPSAFLFYPWDSISIRPFNLIDLKKLYRAHSTGSLRIIMEVLGGTINRDITELTIGDFQYLMYWQRLNSYKKNPLILEFMCTNEDHLKKVVGLLPPLPEDSLKSKITLSNTNISLNQCDPEAVVAYTQQFFEEYGFYLYPARMMDLVDGIEEQGIEEEDDWLNKYAAIVSPTYGKTLAERRAYLETAASAFSADIMTDMDKFIDLVQHGVEEKSKVKCQECGAEVEVTLSIDALQFFPKV